MTLYVLKNIKKAYADRTVLDIPELELSRGFIYSLSGPNGAGKTTLLNILSFLKPPSSGQVLFKSKSVRYSENNLHKLRKTVILVNQHPILFSTTVYKNLEFALKIRKIPHGKRKSIIESTLELVDMIEFIKADARNLSGGETRRIAIARALACSPEVLLLDEPTSDLDLESQTTIENIIQYIHRQNKITIIYCTHNMWQASKLTHSTIYLFNGRLKDSVYENVFRGKVIKEQGKYFCQIKENILIPIKTTVKNDIKISIHPEFIKINKNINNNNAADKYAGSILQLSQEHGQVRALIDVGIPLNVLIDKEKYQGLMIGIGDSVGLCFDPDGVIII